MTYCQPERYSLSFVYAYNYISLKSVSVKIGTKIIIPTADV